MSACLKCGQAIVEGFASQGVCHRCLSESDSTMKPLKRPTKSNQQIIGELRATQDAAFVRPSKGLPLTFLIVGEAVSIGGEPAWMVMEFGYSKTFCVLKSQVHPIELNGLMMEQLGGWLQMINFSPSKETADLWQRFQRNRTLNLAHL